MIAVVADVHVWNHRAHGGTYERGINARGRACIRALGAAREIARAHAAPLFVAGDLFDAHDPHPALVAGVQDVLGGSDHVLAGNHDIRSAAPRDNALGPLEQRVHVYTVPALVEAGGHLVACVPYRKGPPATWLRPVLDELFAGPAYTAAYDRLPRVLVLHAGVRDADTAPWLREAEDAIDVDDLVGACCARGIGVACAGNWHDGRRWSLRGVLVEQVGALVPTGWDNPGDDYGGVVLVGGGVVTRRRVPGPRFATFADVDAAVAWAEDRVALEDHPYVRIRCAPGDVRAVLDEARARLDADGAAWEVVPERRAPLLPAAGQAAVGGVDVAAQALAEYVAGMPLDAGVDRGEVMGAVRGYLQQAGGAA